jgi:homoserine O-acetyltransferase/O-succinyltransferase
MINHANYYSEATQGSHAYFHLGAFELEMGETLPGAKLAYKTQGTLNKARDNAILFPHMYSGTSASMEPFIGIGRPLDPEKYFLILPGQFGNGFSSSPSNTPPPFDRARFPKITIGDDVRAQYRLVTEHFKIEKLQLVLGWSMGAQQTYEWAVRYPGMVLRAAPFGGTAKTAPHNYLFVCLHEEAIKSDPAWNGGNYSEPSAVKAGLTLHSHAFSVMGLCAAFYKQEAWRIFGSTSLDDFMKNFWEAWFLPMDPNNLLCMAWKWRHGDVSRLTDGNLGRALGRIQAKTYVMPFASDMMFPVEDCAGEQGMIARSELRAINSSWAHFAMLCIDPADQRQIDQNLAELLATPV